jgi:hypothetical protein
MLIIPSGPPLSQPLHDKVCPLRGGQHAHERSVENLLSVPSTPTLANTGAEFSDEAAIAALLGEGPGETRLFYCDPRRSDQKGACERNHVEIRKLLPKGAGIRFDRLVPADLALAMSHVNSEPRGALGFATPARAFRAMLGEDAAALLDAYGVGDVPIGELDLTPGLIERARAERGDAPLA